MGYRGDCSAGCNILMEVNMEKLKKLLKKHTVKPRLTTTEKPIITHIEPSMDSKKVSYSNKLNNLLDDIFFIGVLF